MVAPSSAATPHPTCLIMNGRRWCDCSKAYRWWWHDLSCNWLSFNYDSCLGFVEFSLAV